MCTIPIARHFCRESYSEPEAVYHRLKQLGMDLVTVTDHDSIGASESLRRYSDFFLSEEVTCTLPSGNRIHIGVYDITERQHVRLQQLRDDFESLTGYLNEQDLFFTLNHALSGLTGKRMEQDFDRLRRDFPGLETQNGAILRVANEGAYRLAKWLGKAQTGGSDAHTIASLGSAWTEVAGATSKDDFIRGVKAARSTVHGQSGNALRLTRDVLTICHNLVLERAWTAAFLPLIWMGVPAVVAVNYWLEQSFARKWTSRLLPAQVASGTAVAGEAA